MEEQNIRLREKSPVSKINTMRFGELEYTDSDLVVLTKGLIGFESLHDFIIVNRENSRPFVWLQSVENSAIAFPIVDPLFFKPDYKVQLQSSELSEIGVTDAEKARIFVIATIPHGVPENSSINLLGPIVVNVESRIAIQIALTDSDYPTKYYLIRQDEKEEQKRSKSAEVGS
jgi:flagellar assembly factor FliW